MNILKPTLIAAASLTVASSTFALDMEMKTTVIEGPAGQIATYALGQSTGTTIVLIHGDSGRASQWNGVAELLAAGHQVVSYDTRGHGVSDPASDGDYSFAARAAELDVVINGYGTADVILVSHSGGVGVALEYAGQHGDRVRGVFLLDPATDPRAMPQEMRDGFLGALRGPGGLQAVQGYYASIAGENGEVIAQVQADAAVVDAAARLGLAETLLGWDPEAALAGYSGPMATLMSAPNDNPTAIYHLSDNMAHSVVDVSGHWFQIDMPQVVAEAINGFILGLSE